MDNRGTTSAVKVFTLTLSEYFQPRQAEDIDWPAQAGGLDLQIGDAKKVSTDRIDRDLLLVATPNDRILIQVRTQR